MEAQQFHLKWNNHSLNTLSSFQHLLDTHCLVDVSLTCGSGKTVPAHRMVLAACSDYFYRLFKDLPEKHPVIVFKDASEQILNDLLEFMYRGEVEVDDSNLSDFLKFADTLQVKGLSQSEGVSALKAKEEAKEDKDTPTGASTPRDTPPISVKDPSKLGVQLPESMASLNKAYFSSLASGLQQPGAKFPNFFPGLHPLPQSNGSPASDVPVVSGLTPDIYQSLASPNLFNALKRKYPVALGQKPVPGGLDLDSPVLKMPFLKDYFGKHPLPVDLSYVQTKEEDSDDIAEHSPSPTDLNDTGNNDDGNRSVTSDCEKVSNAGSGGGRKPTGRGSRLERMIAAEYKILSEYSENQNGSATPETLPAITPELMKSRRTHSLQLAIGEIMNNRASVQSAATKYHIPRETLRRHYQRYLKAMGINKTPEPNRSATSTPTKSSMETLAAAASAVTSAQAADSGDAASRYSSLLDIGQAYGIWNPSEDNSNDLESDQKDLKIVEDDDEAGASSDDKESDELKVDLEEKDERAKASAPSGLRETSNNNNVPSSAEKTLTAPRVLSMETA